PRYCGWSRHQAGRYRAGLGTRQAGTVTNMLRLSPAVHAAMVAAALDGYPLEACGLMGGSESADGSRVTAAYPTANAAASSRVYTVEPRDMLRADREAEAAGLSIVGVWHSHTHTDAYPSPTDIAQAPDPGWHYVLVSLRDTEPVLRSYQIRDGRVEEEPVAVE
ncbi:MAG: M67 family metallopeptidase, partial [Actinomycetes bacterium]